MNPRPRLTNKRRNGIRHILDVIENLRAEASESSGDLSDGERFVPNVESAVRYLNELIGDEYER